MTEQQDNDLPRTSRPNDRDDPADEREPREEDSAVRSAEEQAKAAIESSSQ